MISKLRNLQGQTLCFLIATKMFGEELGSSLVARNISLKMHQKIKITSIFSLRLPARGQGDQDEQADQGPRDRGQRHNRYQLEGY